MQFPGVEDDVYRALSGGFFQLRPQLVREVIG
jgi:hypothetical protein